ncbi:MAG: DUF364 domain-containing protein [Desulfobacterium sp.]|nr:DUF364 domain-containing protein [Desulfobacterium sp.]
MNQKQLIDLVLSQADALPDQEVTRFTYGAHIVGVESRTMGLATWACGKHPISFDQLPALDGPCSAKELAQLLHDEDPLKSSLGMAALNSLLPDPSPDDVVDVNAADLILELGKEKVVAVIGHFPFVERMKGRFKELIVFEKQPQSGDLDAGLIPERLPSADIVAVTATTFSNGSLAGILSNSSESATKLIIGPSTPVSPTLFELGFDYVAGIVVDDREKVRQGIEEGCSFKQIKGARHIILKRG